jgi:hypothetical protein
MLAMFRMGICLLLTLSAGAQSLPEPEGLLERFLTRMKQDLSRLPDYVCTQTIERFGRSAAEKPWQPIDSLRFEVALVSNRELYALPGGRFQDRPLAAMVARGTIGTGQLGIFAKHVFLTSTTRFSYHGSGDRAGRQLHEYQFEVEAPRSSYRLRNGLAESIVAFQGAFWVDAGTLDLARLEVQAYDIPEKLGLAEADTALDYSRMTIDGTEVLLPAAATLKVTAVNGNEDMNRTRLTACRHYRAESSLHFEEASAAPANQPAAPEASSALPKGTLVELALDASLDPASAKVGDVIKARVVKPVRAGEETVLAEGTITHGRIVRLDTQAQPFQVHVVALEFDTIFLGDRKVPFNATMVDAGPAAGLIRQVKRMDPKFTRRPTGRMDVLVREVQRGQGILLWEARRGPLPRGLRMKWRVQGEAVQ